MLLVSGEISKLEGMGEDNWRWVGKVKQVGFLFMMYSLMLLLLVVHPLESWLRVIFVIFKGPAADCEDDILSEIVVSWTPYNTCIKVFVYM